MVYNVEMISIGYRSQLKTSMSLEIAHLDCEVEKSDLGSTMSHTIDIYSVSTTDLCDEINTRSEDGQI